MIFTMTLPVPPSVNNMFVNVRGRGRVPSSRYTKWKKAALSHLWGVRLPPTIKHHVCVYIVVTEKCRSDLDNCAKAVLDFLVQNKIIADDSKKVVRRIILDWGQIKECEVSIGPL